MRNYELTACVFCISVILVSGCGPKKTEIVPPPVIEYAELAGMHNRRVDAIASIWARAVVEIRWTDEDDKRHFEQGDGPVIVRKPKEMALAVGKLGDTQYWLGCDADRYWLLDLSGDERVAYVGSQAMVEQANKDILPLPVRADRLIDLLDVTPLPAQANVWIDGAHYLITLAADSELGGLNRRLWLDERGRAVRIAMADADGQIVVEAKLSKFKRVALAGKPSGAFPEIAGRIQIELVQEKATATIYLNDISDGAGKIRDVQFDFEDLLERLRIDGVVDVDRPVQR